MNKLIVAVFDTEKKAFEGLTALKALHKDGDISLYASAVINKDEKGEVSVKSTDDQGPIGTSGGLLTGAFVGILAGPVGMAVGAMAGTMGGLFYDLNKTDVDESFVEEVAKALQEGKTAIIADVDEGWTAPVDTRMEALDGMVFRRNRSEVEDEQLKRESDAINAELDELEAELEEADDKMKASIQKQIDASKKKDKAMKEVIDKKMETLKAETKAKEEKINKQLEDAGSKRKKKLEKRKAELKNSFEKQKENLSAAAAKVSEYLT